MADWRRHLLEHKLSIQIGMSVLAMSAVMAVLILTYSLQRQANDYQSLRIEIDREMEAAGHPVGAIDVLGEKDIEERLNSFSEMMIYFLAAVCALVALFTLLVYHVLSGRHISLLAKLNRRTKQGQMVLYPDSLIPNNELGEVLRTHNQMLVDIQNHSDGLEKNLSEARASVVHAAKLSAIGELTASITHDLKNPLAVIMGYTAILQEGLPTGHVSQEKALEILAKINFAAGRISRMVGEMNRFVRKDVKYIAGNSVDQLVRTAHLFIESKLIERDIKFHMEIDQGATFWGDSAAIEQVLINLFANACDAMVNCPLRELNVSGKIKGEQIELVIQDTGGGIAPEHLDKVFNAFFTTKPSGKGTGLGLSISQHIIAEHRGQMRVESELKHGTRFVISLNVFPPQIQENDDQSAA